MQAILRSIRETEGLPENDGRGLARHVQRAVQQHHALRQRAGNHGPEAARDGFADAGAAEVDAHVDEINHHDGGRGVYFQDPAGHYLEIITRPYGSGG